MRKKIIAGNWKMNKSYAEGVQLASEIIALLKTIDNKDVQIILASPFVHLQSIAQLTKDSSNIFIAAQNCHSEKNGAFTGEVSAEMIKSVGAKYVIIGHSERRNYFKEDDELLKKKIEVVLANDLFPVFCCGENLTERKNGTHFECVKQQITNSLFHLSVQNFSKIIIAYEPVWAIGTGNTATPEQAQEMHFFIRNLINKKYSKAIADNLTILYGGSCNAQNAKHLFAQKDIDGGLIGGASLKATEFVDIVKAVSRNHQLPIAGIS